MIPVIQSVAASRVWDSRGRPTVEVEVTLSGGARARAIAPAGASRGSEEASDRRDGGPRLGGQDVLGAVENVNGPIAAALQGMTVSSQPEIDAVLDRLDPTPTREHLGGNATVATSLAVLHAAAAARGLPTWAHLNPSPRRLPRPEIQIMGGGAHAAGRLDLQDFMVVPLSAATMADALEQVAEVYLAVGGLLRGQGKPPLGVADEGGHWPDVDRVREALELLTRGMSLAGLEPGIDMGISLDVAASEFYRAGRYVLAAEDRTFGTEEWIEELSGWVKDFSILAIEDPASEHDEPGMILATAQLGSTALIVGDDHLVTSQQRVLRAARAQSCNAALIKVNQAGTVTSAYAAHSAARDSAMATIVSARSGETEDTSVVDLAVGWEADLIKVGSITRGERTAKWNELLRIDRALGGVPLAQWPILDRVNSPVNAPLTEATDSGGTEARA